MYDDVDILGAAGLKMKKSDSVKRLGVLGEVPG